MIEIAYFRNCLSMNKWNNELTDELSSLLDKKNSQSKFYEITNHCINNALKDIDKKNYKSASIELNLCHNFPCSADEKWDESHFYQIELPNYIEHLYDHNLENYNERLKSLIKLLSNII